MANLDPFGRSGTVSEVRSDAVRVRDLLVGVGHPVCFEGGIGGEVVAAAEGDVIVALDQPAEGLKPGDQVTAARAGVGIGVGPELLGRVIDARGCPIDGGPPLVGLPLCPLTNPTPSALERPLIDRPLPTGVRAIDAVATLGAGQRMGIFAGPGVGKSTLLGQIVRHAEVEVSVIALVGERSREVREFVEDVLGAEGLARSVVVVATGEETPLRRFRAAKAACTIAESFRSSGQETLLVMDSLTRVAHAVRQLGLAAGEPPATRGYPPSVFQHLAELVERAGRINGPLGPVGITGLFTVLVEGDDETEPIGDAVRGLLDGHIRLDRRRADAGQFPAIDPVGSRSRLMERICDPIHRQGARTLRAGFAELDEVAELRAVGAYQPGSHPLRDRAVQLESVLKQFLTQEPTEQSAYAATLDVLQKIAGALEGE
ncbi:MAG: EscN/YscN/HrcN family type III secretion system ATPase [Phycisphaerae bacterium]|nr:EscN/YscN/HrcN family type III secretion system ATPase [Phycisphaerae bacterium]